MNILDVCNVTKHYNIGLTKFNIFKAIISKPDITKSSKIAVKDVSFSIKKGEAFGIIGRNGAGKSTLLQMIAGTIKPNSGNILISGRISALLELGSGFNPDFTGVENIYLAGSILGINKKDMNRRLEEIISFADVGDYINEPVRAYSSGMLMRVAFSVAIAVEPDLLIIDEALSVGDIIFQQKCNLRLRELLAKGVSLLVVTHDTSFVLNICKRALWIESGEAAFLGSADECVKNYLASMASKISYTPFKESADTSKDRLSIPDTDELNINDCKISGTNDVIISRVWLLDSYSKRCNVFKISDTCNIYILIRANKNISNVSAGIELRDRHGQIIFVTGLRVVQKTITTMYKDEERLIKISFDLNLAVGQYTLDLGCGSGIDSLEISHYRLFRTSVIEVVSNSNLDVVHGMVKLPYSITL